MKTEKTQTVQNRRMLLLGRLCLLIPLAMLGVAGTSVPVQAAAPLSITDGHRRPLRIAVSYFDYGNISPWWDGDWQIGQGISGLIADELIKQNTLFDVYTGYNSIYTGRSVNGYNSGIIVRGTITRFDLDKDSIGVNDRERGGRGRGRDRGRGTNILGIGYSETRANVTIKCDLIDAATGRLLRTYTATGQSSKGNFTGFGIHHGNGLSIYASGVDFRSRAFQDTLVGEATRKCVSNLTSQIAKNIEAISASVTNGDGQSPSFLGKVADVEGDTVVVNVGTNQGVRLGDILRVEGVTKVIRDPDTGKVIEERTSVMGTIRITAVTPRTATGYFEGKSDPKVGDRVSFN
jgi:hypothetical protein